MSEDLDIKIGTKTEALWTRVFKESEQLIKQSEDNLEIQQAILDLAKEKIEKEKHKA